MTGLVFRQTVCEDVQLRLPGVVGVWGLGDAGVNCGAGTLDSSIE